MSRFWATAAAGGVVVTILLATGMLFAVRGLDALAGAQRERIRAGESQISLAENLRLSGEAMVSAGRGYLLTGDRALLEQLVRANTSFDHSLAVLRKYARGSHAVVVAQDLARIGDELVHVQKDLVAARARGEAPELLVRFKSELLPVQAALVHSLDELVQQTQQRMDALYAETARERSHLMLRIYVLFALLVLFASVITWLFATHAARVYELEKDAHAVAQRALATRDELMGIVAHDLRNPLTSIGLKAALLERLAHTQDLREGAQSIAGTVRQMERLIASMLDVSVIESGRFFVDPAPCSVDHLLRECVETFSPLFAARGVRLETRANHRLAVQADDERIQQLMSNLLGNALKYAPPHSIVRIAVVESAGVARFSVSDAGPGIAASHLPHVFDRFWKHEQDGRKGTGLGLFIARGIVDAHGGEIGVESEPGQGATFYFTLRIAQPRTESGRTETDELEASSPCVGGLVEPATLHAP